MRNPLKCLGVGIVAVLAFSAVVSAQEASVKQGDDKVLSTQYDKLRVKNDPGGPAPRQDITGAWAGPAGGSTVSASMYMTPLGKKMFALNHPEGPQAEEGTQVPVALSNDPLATCDPMGFPRDVTFELRGIQFVPTPTAMWQISQYQSAWREIWMDGRQLPTNVGKKGGPDPRYYGFSIGHWDGDTTFVVDSNGVDPRTWLDNAGHPHSGDLHVIERYNRLDHNDLQYTVTIDDPQYYTKPFELAKYTLRWIPSQEYEEQLCIPSEIMAYSKLLGDPVGDPSTAKKLKGGKK